jgi:hypothetical protein
MKFKYLRKVLLEESMSIFLPIVYGFWSETMTE